MIRLQKIPIPESIPEKIFSDHRGSLSVALELDNISSTSISLKESFSQKNVLRGLHYQKGDYQQLKYIRVIKGSIIDFLYDVSANDGNILYFNLTDRSGFVKIDSRFAHGFYALEDVVFQYLCIGKYSKNNEISLNIANKLSVLGIKKPIQSDLDKNGELIETFSKNNIDTF